MQSAFLKHEKDFDEWKKSGYPGIKDKTKEFINNVFGSNKEFKMWNHQIDGLLRTIYSYEVLNKKNLLLNIVTGGGKTAIIAAVIFWLKSVHSINKFVILTPNTIVRARLRCDFENGFVFNKFGFTTKENHVLMNELSVHVMESGQQPAGMLTAGIIIGNIQQMYSSNSIGKRNLTYFNNLLAIVSISSSPAQEYRNVQYQYHMLDLVI